MKYEVWRWGATFTIPFPLDYQLSVDHRKTPAEQFTAICHELGHYFCGHFEPNANKDIETEEFEAETVAWVVATRMKVQDPGTIPFLSQYAGKGIPSKVDIGLALSAADQIMKMFSSIDIKSSWLYKHSETFKESVDQILQKP